MKKNKIDLQNYEINKVVLPSVNKKERKALQKKYKKISYYGKSKILRSLKYTGISLVAFVTAALITGEILMPGLLANMHKTIISRIEASSRKEQKEITDDLIPEIEKPETIKNADFLDLSDASIQAINQLSQKLKVISSRYSTYSGKITPSFITLNYDESNNLTSFNIFCDISNDRTFSLSFPINDLEEFENLLHDKDILVTNIINKFNNDYIKTPIALPTITPRITLQDYEYYTTKIQETRKLLNWNEETQDYDFIEVYYFDYYRVDGDKILKGSVSIEKNKAQVLEGFDSNNIPTLYDLYLNDNSQFEKETELQITTDNLSLILLSAKEINKTKSSQKSNNLEF